MLYEPSEANAALRTKRETSAQREARGGEKKLSALRPRPARLAQNTAFASLGSQSACYAG